MKLQNSILVLRPIDRTYYNCVINYLAGMIYFDATSSILINKSTFGPSSNS